MDVKGKMRIKNILKRIFGVAISNCISLVSGVVIGFLVPKMLSIGDYGLYKTFTLYMAYVGFFSLGIIDGIVLDYGGKDLEEFDHPLFRCYWKWYLCIHLVFFTMLIFTLGFINDSENKFIILMISINMLANNFTGYYQQISQITQRFGEYSFRKMLQSVLSILAVVILYISFKGEKVITYKPYVIAVVLINLILVLWYFFTYREISFGNSLRMRDTYKQILHLMKVGFPLLFANLCSTLILTLDRQFVNLLFDTTTYAVYAFAYNMLSLVTVATSAISTILYPILKRTNNSNLKFYYSNFIEIVFIFVFFMLSLYFPLRIFIEYFLPKYVDSLVIFRIIFPGLAISTAITVVMHNYYKTLGANAYYFKKSVVVLAVSGVANAIAFWIFRSTTAISVASIFTMILWYLYVEQYFVKIYQIKRLRNFTYLISMMIAFYAITRLQNYYFACILYIGVFVVSTLFFYKKSLTRLITLLVTT